MLTDPRCSSHFLSDSTQTEMHRSMFSLANVVLWLNALLTQPLSSLNEVIIFTPPAL
uniref:Uncharacterized protein n=1 Tax=Anguilla anguilla TaxID=7936 RepID=A0A0E9URI4_ANGAN